MCGISGILLKSELREEHRAALLLSCKRLIKRGPDTGGQAHFKKAALGHRRLSIIDLNESSNQPFTDSSGRYTLVFNGEIYNYQSIKAELVDQGISFKTNSDTEVLLASYIHFGISFLNKLNGFFAFAIFDSEKNETILARDRFGIKPLLYYKDDEQLVFASEMKALLEFRIPREIDNNSLYTYLQLNYIPEPHSVIKDVKKLSPGHYLKIDSGLKVQKIPFFHFNFGEHQSDIFTGSYDEAQKQLLHLLKESVNERLVADVPLGTFLSGGIDSSLITALAAQDTKNLSTFSIGFADEPLFDETNYALAVSKMHKTNHHVFKLSNQDLLGSLDETLDYIDEPFADSSALAVNLLSKETAKHVKVSLSGDGADEIFSGYHKHMGEYLFRNQGAKEHLVSCLKPLWEALPKSRNSKAGNLFRKLDKFAQGAQFSEKERYWRWASLMQEAEASNFMLKQANAGVHQTRKANVLKNLGEGKGFDAVLATDVQLVLLGDMLRKVDLMSMSHSLEVRTPFLDHRVVNFAFSLPTSMKINRNMKKRILQDAARPLLPEELYQRPKQGFEVPLLKWFRTDLKDKIHKDLLSENFIREQNLFNANSVNHLLQKLASTNPGDAPANVWALMVFNSWWKRYIA